jgi:hypothetical protein
VSGFIEHVTVAGERWDHISDRYYGDPYGYERIIAANPMIPIVPVLGAGARLLVPVIDLDVDLPASDLPPWKRALVE